MSSNELKERMPEPCSTKPVSRSNQPDKYEPHSQGYDYKLFPDLDSKYECAICLQCQKDPYQTTCGHRFCKYCIFTWLRNNEQRCPVDNTPLSEHEVFQDNFAKREILNLKVRCVYHVSGCPGVVELGQIEDHLQVCDFVQMQCPYSCSLKVLRKNLAAHTTTECLHRPIPCSLCFEYFQLNEQEEHFATSCLMFTVPCEHCQASMPRHEIIAHLQVDCAKVPVNCTYSNIGCDEKVPRELLSQHLNAAVQHHLQLLASSYSQLSLLVHTLPYVTEETRSAPASIHYNSDISGPPSTSLLKLNTQTKAGPSKFSNPPTSTSASRHFTSKLDGDSLDKLNNSWENLSLQVLGDRRSIVDIDRRNSYLEKKLQEQNTYVNSLHERLEENERSLSCLSEELNTLQSFMSSGVYFWKVTQFIEIIREPERNIVLHSPGFYTSMYGYKVCLRMNVFTKNDMSFLSIYIHLMQGKYDDFLEWPFAGTITFTVVDQSEGPAEKKHITVSMTSKPGVDAFKRPVTERNSKGFGYMEFISIDALFERPYIKDDSLLLRALVKSVQS